MRKIRILLNRRARIILTVLLCGLFLFTMVPRLKTIYVLSVRKNELLQEKARLTEINAERQQTLATIDTPEGIERIAREQLGMVKQGERSIIRVLENE